MTDYYPLAKDVPESAVFGEETPNVGYLPDLTVLSYSTPCIKYLRTGLKYPIDALPYYDVLSSPWDQALAMPTLRQALGFLLGYFRSQPMYRQYTHHASYFLCGWWRSWLETGKDPVLVHEPLAGRYFSIDPAVFDHNFRVEIKEALEAMGVDLAGCDA